MQQSTFSSGRQHGDGVGGARGAEVRALEGIDSDVHGRIIVFQTLPHAHLLADVEHGGFVPLALADDNGAIHADRFHGFAHGFHRQLVTVLPPSMADGGGASDGGLLNHP